MDEHGAGSDDGYRLVVRKGDPRSGEHILADPAEIWKAGGKPGTFTLSVELNRERIAHLEFKNRGDSTLHIESTGGFLRGGSSKPVKGHIGFFRKFRQTPYNLMLFALLTEAKKNGITHVYNDEGIADRGAGYRAQVAKGLLKKVEFTGGFHSNKHEIGDVPDVTIAGLSKLIRKGEMMPEHLLSPASRLVARGGQSRAGAHRA